jgi:hypothetical protein
LLAVVIVCHPSVIRRDRLHGCHGGPDPQSMLD